MVNFVRVSVCRARFPYSEREQMTTYYLIKFPRTYQDRRWWAEDELDYAKRFVKHVLEKYKVRGRVIKVKVCK